MFRDAFYANLAGSLVFIVASLVFSIALLGWRRHRMKRAARTAREIREMSPGTCVHCPFCHKSIVLDLSTGGHGLRHLIGRELCQDCSKLCSRPDGDPS